jgi:hypothetical protein
MEDCPPADNLLYHPRLVNTSIPLIENIACEIFLISH